MQTDVLNVMAQAMIQGRINEGDAVTLVLREGAIDFDVEPGKGRVLLREAGGAGDNYSWNLVENDVEEEM